MGRFVWPQFAVIPRLYYARLCRIVPMRDIRLAAFCAAAYGNGIRLADLIEPEP